MRMKQDILAQAYTKYYRQIFLYVYAICRNHEMAEDITHDTFVKAVLAMDKSHTNFLAWLYTVGRNLCFNEMKKRSRELLFQSGDISELSDMLQGSDDLLNQFISEEDSRGLYRAIMKLPDVSRQAIVLRWFLDHTFKEIAEILGITEGNARVITHRAIQQLKKLMEES